MNFFIDSANLEQIKEAASYGLLDGAITNPSFAAKEGMNFRELLNKIQLKVNRNEENQIILNS